jgi:hypothetical protein
MPALAEEDLRLALGFQREELGQRHGKAVKDLAQRAHRRRNRVAFDAADGGVCQTSAPRQFALRQAMHFAQEEQSGAYAGVGVAAANVRRRWLLGGLGSLSRLGFCGRGAGAAGGAGQGHGKRSAGEEHLPV